jgi:hypothetical protein
MEGEYTTLTWVVTTRGKCTDEHFITIFDRVFSGGGGEPRWVSRKHKRALERDGFRGSTSGLLRIWQGRKGRRRGWNPHAPLFPDRVHAKEMSAAQSEASVFSHIEVAMMHSDLGVGVVRLIFTCNSHKGFKDS